VITDLTSGTSQIEVDSINQLLSSYMSQHPGASIAEALEELRRMAIASQASVATSSGSHASELSLSHTSASMDAPAPSTTSQDHAGSSSITPPLKFVGSGDIARTVWTDVSHVDGR
jgi:HrpA-like RNA helicase